MHRHLSFLLPVAALFLGWSLTASAAPGHTAGSSSASVLRCDQPKGCSARIYFPGEKPVPVKLSNGELMSVPAGAVVTCQGCTPVP